MAKDSEKLLSSLLFDMDVDAFVDIEVAGLALDSREVRPGYAFIACGGTTRHGLEYAAQAIENGAAVVLFESGDVEAMASRNQIPFIGIASLREKVGILADRFYGSPSKEIAVIGVTGTNGKTSTAHYIAQALSGERLQSGLIGTLGHGLISNLTPSTHTTPDAIKIHKTLASLLQQRAKYAAVEVSSHGIDQGRVVGVSFDVAVFTNLSRDHLDYHGTMDEYAAVKQRLFTNPKLKHAILNWCDPYSPSFYDVIPEGVQVLRYALSDAGEFIEDEQDIEVLGRIRNLDAAGVELDVYTPWDKLKLKLPVIGRFNAENALAALATLLVLGYDSKEATRMMMAVKPVSGRMEVLPKYAGLPYVVVDYAHTPDAMEKVLTSLRQLTQQRLIVVFGCGGNRDQGKRALMGQVAEQCADEIVVTDDNPRHESSEKIIEDILSGFKDVKRAHVMANRELAIRFALSLASDNDVVAILGKGHETYQIIGDNKFYFDDRDVAVDWLGERTM